MLYLPKKTCKPPEGKCLSCPYSHNHSFINWTNWAPMCQSLYLALRIQRSSQNNQRILKKHTIWLGRQTCKKDKLQFNVITAVINRCVLCKWVYICLRTKCYRSLIFPNAAENVLCITTSAFSQHLLDGWFTERKSCPLIIGLDR